MSCEKERVDVVAGAKYGRWRDVMELRWLRNMCV